MAKKRKPRIAVHRTPEHKAADRKLADKIREWERTTDIEAAHKAADKILLSIVSDVAVYSATARAFKKMGKWYA